MSLLELQPGKVARPDRPSSLRSFLEHKLGVVGLAIVILIIAFSFLGPVIYPTDQIHTNLNQVMLHPGSRFPLGTDDLGYNVLGRLMVGGRSSLEVGVIAALLAACVGTIWGAVSGYAGGAVDAFMMRVVDTMLAIPALLLLLVSAGGTTGSCCGTLSPTWPGLSSFRRPSRSRTRSCCSLV
jgi:peptide/nickel transport system permease protein